MFSKVDFLVPSIYFTIVGFLGMAFFFIKNEDKEVSFKVFAIYSVLTVVIFALIGLTGLMNIGNAPGFFMGLQLGIFVFGLIHAATLYRLNSWTAQESFLHEFIFTLYIAMLGALVFLVVFAHFNKQGYALLFTSSFVFFLVPFLVAKCFDYMLMIPEEVYPKWYFPAGEVDLDLPDEVMEENSIIVVEFQMTRNDGPDQDIVKSRSKLPLKIEFTRFFPIFLDQYNDRNPGTQIQFLDEAKQPHGWNFYIKPKWYQSPKFINPDLTIRENGVKENDIIIAQRVQ
jgi:hypothetical protein